MKDKILKILTTHQVDVTGCLRFFLEYLEELGLPYIHGVDYFIKNYYGCSYITRSSNGYGGSVTPNRLKIISVDAFVALLKEPEFRVNDWLIAEKNGYGYEIGDIFQVSGSDGGHLNLGRISLLKETFRFATDNEVESYLKRLLPDWMKVGDVVTVSYGREWGRESSDKSKILKISFKSTSGGDFYITDNYINKYGSCLIILLDDGGQYPFGSTPDEVIVKFTKALQLPVINCYNGEIVGNMVKYGCDVMDRSIIQSIVNNCETTRIGNRKVVSFTLDSGITINYKEAKQILDNWPE